MNLIVSTSKNGVIGLNGQMLWNISTDIERYRKLTLGGILIMGNTTYKSLRNKRLTYHYNIVITSKVKEKLFFEEPWGSSEVIFVNSIEEAIKKSIQLSKIYNKEIFVIGGKQIYEQFEKTDHIKKIYHTIVHKMYNDNQKYTFYTPKLEGFQLEKNEDLPESNTQFRTILKIYSK